jgi:hypothetical protein
MIFKIISSKNLAKIFAFIAQTTASFSKTLIITLVFEENEQFYRRKLAKIAENLPKSPKICKNLRKFVKISENL